MLTVASYQNERKKVLTVGSRTHRNIIATIIVFGAAVALFFGWREFWFLTDDAFIAFRYVSNALDGHGYVWNPEPFRPVEGYTSFLYLVVLEVVWRIFGKEPPDTANYISLLFTFGSILITSVAVMKMQLNPYLERIRSVFLAIVLIGLVTNTSVLTWSSSGLETAMFNFLFLAWILAVILIEKKNNSWKFTVTLLASLVYLTRPDGILLVAGTMVLIAVSLAVELRTKRFYIWSIVSILPLLITPIHLIWRKSFYGEWLPNTYYAKYVAAWPEAGVRYLLSYIVEYALWSWITLLCMAAFLSFVQVKKSLGLRIDFAGIGKLLGKGLNNKICTVVAVSCLAAQVWYYTFLVGGDHFEWRVFSHLPPMLLLSVVYFLRIINLTPLRSALLFALVVVIAMPIPWTYHFAEKEISQLEEKETLYITVGDKLPFFMRPLAAMQDNLQSWLKDHLICVRWREHQLFFNSMVDNFPLRSLEVPSDAGQFPVAAVSTVGVTGWVLPKVSVIDAYGLNDYVIARYRGQAHTDRKMAHDRTPPDNYLSSYMPNVFIAKGGKVVYYKRSPQFELTAEKIKALDSYWVAKIIRGQSIPDSLAPFPIMPQ